MTTHDSSQGGDLLARAAMASGLSLPTGPVHDAQARPQASGRLDSIDERIEDAQHRLDALKAERDKETQRLARIGKAIEDALGVTLTDQDVQTLCGLLRSRLDATPPHHEPGRTGGIHSYFER